MPAQMSPDLRNLSVFAFFSHFNEPTASGVSAKLELLTICRTNTTSFVNTRRFPVAYAVNVGPCFAKLRLRKLSMSRILRPTPNHGKKPAVRGVSPALGRWYRRLGAKRRINAVRTQTAMKVVVSDE